MKAIVISRFGGPDAIEVRDVTEVTGKSGQTIVEVEFGGLNFADLMSATAGYPGTPPPPLIAGREFCGIEVGTKQRVMGYAQWGAFAERFAARPELMWPVPVNWSSAEGAAFPVNFFTAYLAYWKAGLSEPASAQGAKVFIHATAGGVGTAAVQIGKLLGVEMFGTSSSDEKLQRAKELGLHHGINYKKRDYEEAIKDLTHGDGVDAVFEMLGGEHTNKSIRCLRSFGRVITYGSASGQPSLVETRLLYAKSASVHGLWLSQLASNRELMNQAWNQLSKWAEEGKLRPVVGHVFPMEQAADGYRLLSEGKNFGKIVIEMNAPAKSGC